MLCGKNCTFSSNALIHAHVQVCHASLFLSLPPSLSFFRGIAKETSGAFANLQQEIQGVKNSPDSIPMTSLN